MIHALIPFDIGLCSAISAVAVLLTTSFLLGRLLIHGKIRSPGENIISLVVGIDLLAVFGYFLGTLRILSVATVIILLLVVVSVAIFFFFKEPVPLRKSCLIPKLRRYMPILIPLSILPIILGRAICIPTGWDELTYQLAVPERWIQSGNLAVFPDNPYSAFPSAASAYFQILMLLGGILAPRIFILTLWCTCTCALYLLIRPGVAKWHAAVLTFGFSASFAVIMSATSAYVELFILIQIAGILLLLRESTKRHYNPFFLPVFIGLMAGIAGSVKLTGLVVGVAFIFFLLPFKWTANKEKWTSMLYAYLSVYLLTLVIFYIRPFLYTGNPFYPFFSSLFSINDATVEMSRYHHLVGSLKYGIHGITGFFTAPVLLAFSGSTFDGGFGYQFAIVLLLSLFSAAYALNKGISKFSFLFTAAFIFYVFWFFTSQQSRFLIPAIFLMFLASKPSFRNLSQPVSRMLVILVLILTILSLPLKILKDSYISWKSALGMIKTEDYLYSATGPGYLKAVYVANTRLPKDAKIMLLFENRGLFFNRNYVLGTPFVQEKFFTPPEKTATPAALLSTLKDNQISHLVIGLSENDPDRIASYVDRTANLAKIIGFMIQQGKLKTLWQDEGFGIYEVGN